MDNNYCSKCGEYLNLSDTQKIICTCSKCKTVHYYSYQYNRWVPTDKGW
jgi:hypothetical protein